MTKQNNIEDIVRMREYDIVFLEILTEEISLQKHTTSERLQFRHRLFIWKTKQNSFYTFPQTRP